MSSPASGASPKKKKNRRYRCGEYHFDTGKVLGTGSFAKVYAGHHETRVHEKVAVKRILLQKIDDRIAKALESEVRAQQQMEHANIVRLLHVRRHKEAGWPRLLVLEMCEGGDLQRYIKRNGPLHEVHARRLLAHLVNGVSYLHQRQFIHRDLKPQNLLLTSTDLDTAVLKIADFGFVRELAETELAQTMCGTPLFMAPELFLKRPYDHRADYFSIGLILHYMLLGKTPIVASNIVELGNLIRRGVPLDHARGKVSGEAFDLMQRLLALKPSERLADPQSLLSHAFFHRSLLPAATRIPLHHATPPLQPIRRRRSSASETAPIAVETKIGTSDDFVLVGDFNSNINNSSDQKNNNNAHADADETAHEYRDRDAVTPVETVRSAAHRSRRVAENMVYCAVHMRKEMPIEMRSEEEIQHMCQRLQLHDSALTELNKAARLLTERMAEFDFKDQAVLKDELTKVRMAAQRIAPSARLLRAQIDMQKTHVIGALNLDVDGTSEDELALFALSLLRDGAAGENFGMPEQALEKYKMAWYVLIHFLRSRQAELQQQEEDETQLAIGQTPPDQPVLSSEGQDTATLEEWREWRHLRLLYTSLKKRMQHCTLLLQGGQATHGHRQGQGQEQGQGHSPAASPLPLESEHSWQALVAGPINRAFDLFMEFEKTGGFNTGGDISEELVDYQGLELVRAFALVRGACENAALAKGTLGLEVVSTDLFKLMLKITGVCFEHHNRGMDHQHQRNSIFRALRTGTQVFCLLFLHDAACLRGLDVATAYRARIQKFLDQLYTPRILLPDERPNFKILKVENRSFAEFLAYRDGSEQQAPESPAMCAQQSSRRAVPPDFAL